LSIQYVVRSHNSGVVSAIMKPDSFAARVAISLDIHGYDILTAYPLTALESKAGHAYVANLGLVGKMTGAAAIVSNEIELLETGRVFLDTKLKALGVLGELLPPLLT
jgi:predicted CoA-binding protein